MSSASLNALCAAQIVDALLSSGVDAFFLSPGSRATPLAMAIAKNPQAKCFIHYDERGMAFMALGYAKASSKPAVIITTSGSAVGNLLPAVMEADQSRIPLLLLTCDRPAELIDTGSNQTIDQNKAFSAYVRWEHILATPSSSIDPSYVASTMAYAAFAASNGPIHINCPFAEPLYDNSLEKSCFSPPTFYEDSILLPSESSIQKWVKSFFYEEEGIILLGEGACSSLEEAEALAELAEKLQWPILADILSGYRGYSESICYYQSLIQAGVAKKPKIILQFGGRMVSKLTQEWIKNLKTLAHLQLIAHSDRIDPLFHITHRLMSDTLTFCKMALPHIKQKCRGSFPEEWQEKSALATSFLKENMADASTEPGVMHALSSLIEKDTSIFCGSSMPIRDADHFFYPKKTISFFASRGVSGIDGNIATACGIAYYKNQPMIAILGDTAALHDLNSLALVKKCPHPMILVIINNDGCGIFSFLNIAKDNPHFERFFSCSHGYEFSHAAKLFGIDYLSSEEPQEIEQILKNVHTLKSCLLLEVKTSRKENHKLHQELDKKLQEVLCSKLILSPI